LVEPAITRLAKLLKAKHGLVALSAVRDVLDRNGLKAPAKLELEGRPPIVIAYHSSMKPPGM
jgi:hypothetical protein